MEDKRIVAMQLDKPSSSLYVAFSTCVIKVPLGRCERHGKCKKYVLWPALNLLSEACVPGTRAIQNASSAFFSRACIASRDPYCGWVKESGACTQLVLGAKWVMTPAGKVRGSGSGARGTWTELFEMWGSRGRKMCEVFVPARFAFSEISHDYFFFLV